MDEKNKTSFLSKYKFWVDRKNVQQQQASQNDDGLSPQKDLKSLGLKPLSGDFLKQSLKSKHIEDKTEAKSIQALNKVPTYQADTSAEADMGEAMLHEFWNI